ncbi:MAG: leucine-rich repeat domain-containing protein, partial [Clostridia bacterium]|nr:leucine-rich repeat domain-containing protein [Clostridia bacterium]
MSCRNKTFSSSGTVYHRIYEDMAGVDFSGDGSRISDNRFAYLENMWRDWSGEGAGVTESIPGFRRLKNFGGAIRGLFTQKTSSGEYLLVHAGTGLFRCPMVMRDDPAFYVQVASVADRESRGFSCGEDFYLLDGERITKVDPTGNSGPVGDGLSVAPYIPTTYNNGEPYEQRNLFSDRFRETTVIGTKALFASGTPGLSYEKDTAADDGSLILKGRGSATDGLILVPAFVKVGGEYCRVKKIAERAFLGDNTLTGIVLADGGVESVGAYAFKDCRSLIFAALGDSVKTLGYSAFEDCRGMEYIYIDAALTVPPDTVFNDCRVLRDIYYAGTQSEFDTFDEKPMLVNSYDITVNTSYPYDYLTVPIFSDAASVTSFSLGGIPAEISVRTENGRCKEVVAKISKISSILNAQAEIRGVLLPCSEQGKEDFFSRFGCQSGASAIEKCTLCETFDGRIFLSGNPDYPGVVFYTSRDSTGANCPTYFGIYNYFQDGVGHIGILDMLSVGSTLAVFKTADDGGGSIFYHTPKDTDSDLVPKIYPVTYVHTGLCAKAGAISFFDDAVFLSEEGLSALESTSNSGEKRLAVRSHNVSEKLLAEDLTAAKTAVFAGYLVISVNGRMYLADSRRVFTHSTGNREYEWYFLSGIGTYSGDKRVYRYSSAAPKEYAIGEQTDIPVRGETVFSEEDKDGNMHAFVYKGASKVAVEPTEEFEGGVFSPATVILGLGDLLFFGTASGALCLFNTDKRGVPPERIASESEFDPAEYAETYGRRIHPDFYDFDRHAPRYAVKTVKDNCGAPHLTKDTVKHSMTLKCRTYAATTVKAEVGTERLGFRTLEATVGTAFSFWDLDFSTLALDGSEYLTLP